MTDMTDMTETHIVHLESSDRDMSAPSTTTARYRMTLPRDFKNVVAARLVSAEIPGSFYVFRQGYRNTDLTIRMKRNTQTIEIPDGNYDTRTLLNTITQTLSYAFPPLKFCLKISTVTQKLRLICVEGFAMNIVGGGLLSTLGFAAGQSGASIDAPRMFVPNPYTYLVMDIAQLNGAYEGPVEPFACFAKIPFDTNSFGFVFYQPTNATFLTYAPPIARLRTLDVTFRFRDGIVVDFENIDHSFTIELKTKSPGRVVPRDVPHLINAATAVDAATAASHAALHAVHAVNAARARAATAARTTPPQKLIPSSIQASSSSSRLCLVLVVGIVVGSYLVHRRR